jgi:hypothetical protein
MTVAELITKLQALDPLTQVGVFWHDEYLVPARNLRLILMCAPEARDAGDPELTGKPAVVID